MFLPSNLDSNSYNLELLSNLAKIPAIVQSIADEKIGNNMSPYIYPVN